MSETVASAFQILRPDETHETRLFIRMMDQFFDSLNVKSPKMGILYRKDYCLPYTSPSDHRFKVYVCINKYVCYSVTFPHFFLSSGLFQRVRRRCRSWINIKERENEAMFEQANTSRNKSDRYIPYLLTGYYDNYYLGLILFQWNHFVSLHHISSPLLGATSLVKYSAKIQWNVTFQGREIEVGEIIILMWNNFTPMLQSYCRSNKFTGILVVQMCNH